MDYDEQTLLFGGIDNIVFKSPLKLTGGQIASLIENELALQMKDAKTSFKIGQVKLETDPQDKNYCVITVTVIVEKETIAEPLEFELGIVGAFLADSLLKYILLA